EVDHVPVDFGTLRRRPRRLRDHAQSGLLTIHVPQSNPLATGPRTRWGLGSVLHVTRSSAASAASNVSISRSTSFRSTENSAASCSSIYARADPCTSNSQNRAAVGF